MRISAVAFEAGRWEEHVKKGVLSFISDCIVSGEIRFQEVLCSKRKRICYKLSQWVYFCFGTHGTLNSPEIVSIAQVNF